MDTLARAIAEVLGEHRIDISSWKPPDYCSCGAELVEDRDGQVDSLTLHHGEVIARMDVVTGMRRLLLLAFRELDSADDDWSPAIIENHHRKMREGLADLGIDRYGEL